MVWSSVGGISRDVSAVYVHENIQYAVNTYNGIEYQVSELGTEVHS